MTATPSPKSVVDWSEYQDDISDAISESVDIDWNANDGARAVVRWLNDNASMTAPQAEALALRSLLDNLVIAQGLSKEIRDHATSAARSYLYNTRKVADAKGEGYRMTLVEKQPFERFPELAAHIERMASTGAIGGMISWDAFLRELNAVLAAAPAPSSLAGGEWRDPSEVPEAKKGEYAYRIVAVKRADGEKVVSFSAFYMNAVPLWFEDDNESRNVTGWHSDSEGDDGPTYSPLLTEGDALMGWREFPRWEAALSPEAPARDGVEWFGVTGAADETEALAVALFDARCPGIRMTDEDLHYYRAAAQRAMQAVADELDTPALTPRHEAPAEGDARRKLIQCIKQWDGEAEYDTDDLSSLADSILHAFNGPPVVRPAAAAELSSNPCQLEAPAEGAGEVVKACAAFQEAIDYFEADVADAMAEESERADLWDREATVNIDALKTVMAAALATREEAPAEAGELGGAVDRLAGAADFLEGDCVIVGDHEVRGNDLLTVLSALRAQPPAREDAQPVVKPAPFNPGGIGHAMYQAFHAYHADYVLSTDGADYDPTPFERDLIEDFFAGLMAEEAFFGPVRALYDTHPAPDALRVALQSVQRMAGNSSFNINQNGVTLETGDLMRVFDDIERIALAALQAEQGAK